MDNYNVNNNCQLSVANCQFNKEKYRLLCQTEESIPIFSRDWWLDLVCGEKYWDVLIIEKNNRITATFPVYLPSPGVISMPPYTQTMGPWFAPEIEIQKPNLLQTRKQDLLKLFLCELKKYPYFLQNFHHSIQDWLPFYWEKYKQTTRYTYILENIQDFESIWSGMSGDIHRNIKKAGNKYQIEVKKGVAVEELLQILTQTFNRQDLSPKHLHVLKNLIQKCRERGQGDIWGGYDPQGRLHAAVFVAWQQSSAYYLAGGGNPQLRKSGAHSLTLWESIRSVSAHTSTFDFEGSMLPGVEYFFRGFGGKQTPYFTIFKGEMSLLYKAWLKFKNRIR
ncbi:MAG: GNAT family N-acetyltransferase [Tannerellaceae bacterium]|nr:GNAT family N-acetyltransferase [Tannerellaceae bacterium]